MPPADARAALNLLSVRAPDVDTSNDSCEYASLANFILQSTFSPHVPQTLSRVFFFDELMSVSKVERLSTHPICDTITLLTFFSRCEKWYQGF